MIEAGNKTHIQGIQDVRSGEVRIFRFLSEAVAECLQEVMRQFCEALPADRLLQGNDCNLEGALAEERLLRTFTEPLTGAKLTYSSSLPVLAHFVGCLVRMPVDQPNLQLIEDSPITAKQHCKRHTS